MLLSDQFGLPTDGETVLAASIGENLLLVSGVTDTMPGVVPALLNGDPAMSMTATVFTWNRKDASPEASIGFVAIVPVRVAGRVRIRSIVMRRKGQPARYTLIRRALPVPHLMNIVSADAGAEFSQVSDSVSQALLSGRADPKRVAAALSILTDTARNDGFVEVMGVVDTGQIFLQGWASELPTDQTCLIVSHDGLAVGEFRGAKLQRDDLGERGYGFLGILDMGKTAAINLPDLQRLFFRSGQGWRTLDIYDRRVLLSSTDVPAHIRDVLPRASANSETLKTLRKAGERFDGRDTVSTLKEPVRIGMDMVLEMPTGGMLVSGWMLDPERLVESVTIHAGKDSVAIHETWTRLSRQDVTTAFQQDSAFFQTMAPFRHDHGFLAFVPGLSSTQDPVYFELSLGSESAAFYPLKPVRTSSRRALDRIMSILDPHSAAATMAIEAHIGPMIQVLDHQKPRAIEFRDFGYDESAAATGLALGGSFDAEEILITLSLLALDPDTRDIPIVVSVPAELFGKIAAEVRRIASFYGLGVRLVAAEGVQDPCDALEAAVQVMNLETCVFLTASVLPRRQGWLSLMERAYRMRDGKVLVSPTVVFEDNSICFAGTSLDHRERRLVDNFLGYPSDVICHAEPTEVMAGSIACCILSRSAFQDIGGFSQSYLSTKDKGRDFCLKLKLAGTPSLWLPEVEMIAADGAPGDASLPWQRLVQHVDRWSFDRRWSHLVANMRG
ncbi:glycosyltransferase family 2 protein [Microvirga sp. 2MCAF38]|uniref:glycosyltransferase family 2 protein n=1 Tax=Microvirga sp. 2MCAF38 TaxID=3232989 RepID=UPI003F9977DC